MSAPARWSLQHGERKSLLLSVDALLLAASVVLAMLVWMQWDPQRAFELRWIGLVPVWLLSIAISGCYEVKVAAVPKRVLRALLIAASILVGLYVFAYFIAPPESLPRSVVLVQVAIGLVTLVTWRLAFASLSARPSFRRRVLIIGSGRSASAIGSTLKSNGLPTFELVGSLHDDAASGSSAVGHPVLGAIDEVLETIERHRVSEVVVAVDGSLSPVLLEALLVVQERGIQVTPMPLMHEALTGQVPVAHLGSNWWGTLPLDHPQTRAMYSLAKRMLDLAIAIPSLFTFAVLLPFLGTAIKLDSKGPVFYRQRRVGKHGRDFMMMKLRTMIVDAEPEGRAVWAARRDPRVTRVGRLLRATMLDEIPQLWNVVKGEMSIVGPRPERPELVAELETTIPYYRLRHAAAPGMAGWSLLHEGYSGSAEKALTKLQYDLYYIKHQSLWLDLQIILRTLGRGLTFRRSERKSEESDPVLH